MIRRTSPSLFPPDPEPSPAAPPTRPAVTPARTAPGAWIFAPCDGGAPGNPGPSGFGAVLTGPDGTKLAELSQFLGIQTNNVAEYSGLLAVLDYAVKHGH